MRALFYDRKVLSITNPLILAAAALFVAGCGAVPVRHVPQLGGLTSEKMSDLHGSQPVDVRSGAGNSTEMKIGAVGVGKVFGNLAEWTGVVVEAVKTNLAARGATITVGASKTLTITMTKAQVKAIPLIGVSNGKIVLTATTSEGLNSTFEGASSSMAPLAAVDGAVADAVKKLLTDSAVDAYLRK